MAGLRPSHPPMRNNHHRCSKAVNSGVNGLIPHAAGATLNDRNDGTIQMSRNANKNMALWVAEREGFEPSMPLQACRISSAVHSTTLPPLRKCRRRVMARLERGRGT